MTRTTTRTTIRTTTYCAALLLTTSSAAWASEDGNDPTQGAPAESQVQTSPTPEPPTSVPSPVASASTEQVIAVEASASISAAPSGPEPYTGWARGKRAPIYVTMMMTAGAYGEDGGNRLTTRDSKILEGVGGVFRVGAVLGEHHRLGARMQSFFRPTKKVLLETPTSGTTTNEWGAVTFGYIGPEYIYTTGFGLYAGGSIGLGGAMSTKDIDHDDSVHKDNDNIERGSAGGAGILSLGYEWRASKWFAMNAEVYGGLYHGIDDNEKSMNGGLFGMGMGVGF